LNIVDEIAGVFHALSHSSRLCVLMMLAEKPQTISEISGELGVRFQLARHFIQTLQHAELIEDATWRGGAVWRVKAGRVTVTDDFLIIDISGYRMALARSLEPAETIGGLSPAEIPLLEE
jgi:hypothetical protein